MRPAVNNPTLFRGGLDYCYEKDALKESKIRLSGSTTVGYPQNKMAIENDMEALDIDAIQQLKHGPFLPRRNAASTWCHFHNRPSSRSLLKPVSLGLFLATRIAVLAWNTWSGKKWTAILSRADFLKMSHPTWWYFRLGNKRLAFFSNSSGASCQTISRAWRSWI